MCSSPLGVARMFYLYAVTVPRSTPASAPVIEELALGPGEIGQVRVGFPWGCAGLVHVQVWRAEHQVWPTDPGASFAWNDYVYEFPEAEPVAGPVESWTIRAWNLDERHDHVVQVALAILPVTRTLLGKVAESLFGG